MPQFKNTADLMAYVRKSVDRALTEDVFPVVQETEADTIVDVVYSQPTSGYYRRRGEYDGFGDPYNIVIKGGVAKNGILSVVNVTVPNPYLNGVNGEFATTNKDLQYLIEFGRSRSGDPGYDYWPKPKARPFTAKTIERLEASGACTTALKNGLKRQGIAVK